MALLTPRRVSRCLALLAAAIMLLAALPSGPAAAQGDSEIQTLDNSQVQFARGVFQRTALSADQSNISSVPADARGAVQLAPTGALKPWEKIAVELPNSVLNTGRTDDGTRGDPAVVALGSRLFVIAGTNATGSTNTVLWASINQVLGEVTNHGVAQSDPRYVNESWLNAPLPAATIVPTCTTAISRRTRAAAGALPTSGNEGFIYVVGGLTEAGECRDEEVTAAGVQIGAVAANGAISWSTSPNSLPSGPFIRNGIPADLGPRGVEMSTATVIRTGSGKAFLYVIGGLSTFYDTAARGVVSSVEKTVFRAEINPATGAIGEWVRDDDVPLSAGAAGIYDHVAVHASTIANTAGGPVVKDGIVVAGGFTELDTVSASRNPNTFVYRADVNADTGDLTWNAAPSSDGNQVSLGLGGQTGMSAVSYNNKLYLIGGEIPGNPAGDRGRDTVLTAVYDDNLAIQPSIPGSTDYFVGRSSPVLPNGPRVNSGAALMDALPPADNPTEAIGSAWVIVVGGSTEDGTRSRFLFRGRIGGDEADSSIRASDGWFYSSTFNVTFAQTGGTARNARVLSIRWASEIKRDANANADIQVEFRKTLRADPNCPNDSVFTASDQWYPLDADTGSPFYSKDAVDGQPFNTVTLKDAFGTEDFIATCFQYRARFIQNGLVDGVPQAAAAPGVSPKLLSMNIEKVVAGNPDIRIQTLGYNAPGGRLSNLSMVIQNLSLEGRDNTIDAGLDNGDGGFWVHLCVAYAPQGQPAPTLEVPTLPLAEGQKVPCMQAYYQVYMSQMRAGSTLALVNSGDQVWKRQTGPTTEETITDIRMLFSQPGTYKVALLLDTWNYVREGTAGEANNAGQEAASNNQPQILTFEITGPPLNLINLPLVRR
jgi:hypothetical protein